MPDLYPLLMIPIFDERPWGVRDLRPIYTRAVTEPIGESWLTWEDNRVANGPLAGCTLADLSKQHGRELVGSLARYEDRFPLLVKFLFTSDKLSVQVHPDDEQARRVGQPCGKTECWYALSARPGSQVALGLRPGVSLEQFRQAIADQHAEELLNWVDVHPGDMLYVAAGTVHTIAGGLVLVETQQTSDITYRLYDYGRPRELHVEAGLAATKLHTNAGKVVRATGRADSDEVSATLQRDGRANPQVRVNDDQNLFEPASAGMCASRDGSRFEASSRAEPATAGEVERPAGPVHGGDANVLVRSPFFQVEKMPLREPLHSATSAGSPHILVALKGSGIVESHGMEPISFATGDAVVVPACVGDYRVRPQWELEIMRMSLPSGPVAEPETELPRSVSSR